MKVHYGFDSLPAFRSPVVTVGSYDGVHCGHRAILQRINEIAEQSKHQAVALNQMNVGIEQISAVVQTSSATSEESSAASQEMANQATHLKELVEHFNLRSEVVNGTY